MPLARVGAASNTSLTSTVTVTRTCTTGNLLVAFAGANVPLASLGPTAPATNWTVLKEAEFTSGNTQSLGIYARIVQSGEGGVSTSYTFTGTSAGVMAAFVVEFSGAGNDITKAIPATQYDVTAEVSATDRATPILEFEGGWQARAIAAIWFHGGDSGVVTSSSWGSTVTPLKPGGTSTRMAYSEVNLFSGDLNYGISNEYYSWEISRPSVAATVVIRDPDTPNIRKTENVGVNLGDPVTTDFFFDLYNFFSSDSISVTERPNYYSDQIYITENIIIYISPKNNEFFIWFG